MNETRSESTPHTDRIRNVAMSVWVALVSAIAIYGFSDWPDRFRYGLGVLCLVTFPGATVFWLVIHPFIGIWRTIGMIAAYTTSAAVLVLMGFLMYSFRNQLLGKDLGNHWILLILGVPIYSVSAWMELQCRRVLKKRTLTGVPELKDEKSTDRLLDKGIYRLVRHPRYLSIIVGAIALSLIANYVGVYVLALLMIPGMSLITAFEEAELVERFGQAYEEYRSEVPRLRPTRESLRHFRNVLRTR